MLLRKKPSLCNYYLTYRCNARCSFCDIWEKPSPYADVETIQQNLKLLKTAGVKIIDFTGGEPLLHRRIGEVLDLAKQAGFMTTLTTNCLLYPKKAEELFGKVDMLHFSIDAATKEKHDRSRGVACFDQLLESIEVARRLGERPDLLFTVTPTNLNEVEPILEKIARPNGLLLIVNPVFQYFDDGLDSTFTPNQLKELEKIGKQKGIYLNTAFLTLRKAGGNRAQKPVCLAGDVALAITPENQIALPCYHSALEHLPAQQLGKASNLRRSRILAGRMPACEGCTINCYMEPSFAIQVNKYWLQSFPSTLKYLISKGMLLSSLRFALG